MTAPVTMFAQTRKLILASVARLEPVQWLTVPEGFDNNIAWNVGHIIAVQQSLVYRLSGVEQYTDKAFFKRYRPGSSPADWETEPDCDALKAMLAEHVTLLEADYAAGKFQQYMAYETITGVRLTNVEEALVFNAFHEGLHLGTILSLRNLI